MKKYLKPLIFIAVMLCGRISTGQDWLWIPDDTVLNSSGLNIHSYSTQFQVLDWNRDRLWDFLINESGELVYYEQVPGQSPFWVSKGIDLPEVGLHFGDPLTYPKNFEFFDWDEDGDFDLAADDSRFWWNQGTHESPVWIRDDSILSGIESGKNLFFIDYDADGDWDATGDTEPFEFAVFFLNEGSNVLPLWTRKDSLLHFGGAAQFVHWNSDLLLDLAELEPLVTTGGGVAGFGIAALLNKGSLFETNWQYLPKVRLFWTAIRGNLVPAYDLVDYNQNSLLDVIKTDWQRHIAIHLNQGSVDSSEIHNDPESLLGAVNVESQARPFFFDANSDNLADLVVTGDFLIDFLVYVFHDGQIHTYKNLNGHFDPGVELKEKVPQQVYPDNPNFKKSLTLSFGDVDGDGDQDYVLGFIQTNTQGKAIASAVLYFNNVGTPTNPNWQPDSTRFTYFLQPDSMFYAPQLIDIDHDGDLDLFIQRRGEYTFYERLNTVDENWQENRTWLTGINSREHYSAVFTDLTRDGEEDLVFGEGDGTLRFYENVGTQANPLWQPVESTFAGIDVDSLAAPAFADLNGDHRLDMVVGNAEGRLFYFQNESTVDVSSPSNSEPTQFQLFQNYPNPFNPETTIEYELAKPGRVQLTIYNLLGQRVRTLVDAPQPAGRYHVSWDGSGESRGLRVASSVYLYELKVGNKITRKKMILIR